MHGIVRTRRQRILNTLSFILLSLFVAVGTIILVLIAKGYDFDFSTRAVIQNGLVLIASEPVSANITIDDETTGDNTPQRVTIPAGRHEVTLNRSGYRDWSRAFDLSPGEVLWLSYPLLLPDSLETRQLLRPGGEPAAEASPDSSLVAVTGGLGLSIFHSNDIEAEPLTVDLTDSLSDVTGTIKSVVWAEDNSHFIVTIDTGKTSRLALITLRNNQATVVDVNNQLAKYSQLRFVSDRVDQLYGLRAGALWRIKISDGQPIQKVSEHVDRYSLFESALLTWSTSSQRVVLHQGERHTVLDTPPAQDVKDLTLSTHDHHLVASFTSPTLGTIVVIDPATAQQQVITHPRAGDHLLFGPEADYLVSESVNHFQVYDFERSRFYTYDLPLTKVTHLRWATGAQLVGIADNSQAVIFDFDGSNYQTITKAVDGLIVMNPGKDRILNFTKSSVSHDVIWVETELHPAH